MADLAGQYHCIAPDLRGFGRSERAPVDARRGLRDFSDDLRALLTETGLLPEGPPPILLGWSLGGGVVLQYAIDHPGSARALVLESPMAPFGFGGTRDVAGTPCYPDFAGSGGGTANPEMVRRISTGDRTDEDLVSPRRVLTTLYGQPPFDLGRQEHAAEPAGTEDDLVEAMLEIAIGEDNLGALGAVPGWPGADVFPAQPMVGQMRALLDRYRAAGGRSTEHVLACSHSPHLERPAEFRSLVAGLVA
ncbi:MAG: alpha/beta hydrolase [Streptosporangiaceae bacterium]